MAGFLNRLKGGNSATSKADGNASPKNKKDEPAPELTPLDKLLQNAGPLREDGSDKFFGLENFGNTCYCNSIVQALYYSEPFRENVVNYPPLMSSASSDGAQKKVNVTIRPPVQPNGAAAGQAKGQKGVSSAQALKARQTVNGGQVAPLGQPVRPEDKPDSPEYKKKQAMIRGPVLELAQENPDAYGMQECTFTGLKDIFTALIESDSRTGVLSPQRFLDIFKRDNEMFRNSMHQDAHEFYGLVLNDVIANVEAAAKRLQEKQESKSEDGLAKSLGNALGASNLGARGPGTGWVHDIFEGVLTSETRCLTCETASQRDETFLDLSIDLEEHSSVTSCLQKFSAEEMLCERNKFHCDHCGGLQEAEKRMKIKKLPKVLALHLKRFKYTEDYSRLQKLFHRVVYPYHLRMFNTTDDAEDPDRMYELYAVVVHIGGNAYHGHYVSVIKTKDRGWLLFDDEMVEPVDKHFVRNFFGDRPGMACAYVLFYQEVSFEKVREELDAEGLEEVRLASQKADLALGADRVNGAPNGVTPLTRLNTQPVPPVVDHDALATLNQVKSAPGDINAVEALKIPSPVQSPAQVDSHPMVAAPPPAPAVLTEADKAATIPPAPPVPPVPPVPLSPQIKEDKAVDKKGLKAQEKARKAAEKEQAKLAEKERLAAEKEQAKQLEKERSERREAQRNEREQLQRILQESKQSAAEEEKRRKKGGEATSDTRDKSPVGGFLNRASRGSKSMTRKSFAFLNSREKEKEKAKEKEKTEERSDRESTPGRGEQNGVVGGSTTSHSPIRTTATERTETSSSSAAAAAEDQPPYESKSLKGRFSFGLKRKKSAKFLS
ncbi:cysteine proteinase [Echria macrotheca]|uniref:Ubiquitin carboxyl-terminal hydrolase n=1 Tax=Echria macrotheca TaxID=438768 RepID=A0AAJ0BB98_9PEZI|nr:cysteine proteinase [Echria macrotheca]